MLTVGNKPNELELNFISFYVIALPNGPCDRQNGLWAMSSHRISIKELSFTLFYQNFSSIFPEKGESETQLEKNREEIGIQGELIEVLLRHVQ